MSYEMNPDGTFIIRDYDQKKPFSNFLPGIAGLYGTPLWAFYVNRGQGVVSFGVRDKDGAILEFFPANKAYQMVTSVGFRTFIKFIHGKKHHFYEPFRDSVSPAGTERVMAVAPHEFWVRETNRQLGLEIKARYFTLPGEPIAALVREVTFTNLTSRQLDLEILDGLPQMNPYGMNEFFVKNMSRTIEAWMSVENLREKKAPFTRLRVDATDRPEVLPIDKGNFYFGLTQSKRSVARLLEPIADPAAVFGPALDFSVPRVFLERTPFKATEAQMLQNKTPCAFVSARLRLGAHRSERIWGVFGHAPSLDSLNRYLSRALHPGYLDAKRAENEDIIDRIRSRTFTVSSTLAYDLYCGQTYLDNVLRGGMPVHFGEERSGSAFYVYSRKHGDLERDYNRFALEPAYFSQGNGSYRDVNQNRRNDVWFDPRVGEANVRTFVNLIQLDGFNPLVLKGTLFRLRKTKESSKTLAAFFDRKALPKAEKFLSGSFDPGAFCRFLEEERLLGGHRFERLMAALGPFLIREEKAEHGEGFWIDHWTYNLDLIESYLAIFPEKRRALLFEDRDFIFYDNDHFVAGRGQRYVLQKRGAVRQFQSVLKDKDKARLLAERKEDPHWTRDRWGKGKIYKTGLFVKLFGLFLNKFASLDPRGIGIEMEADKPSWYDALNGLPGLVGSSLSESFELKRLAIFLIEQVNDLSQNADASEFLPHEFCELFIKLEGCLNKYLKDRSPGREFIFWDTASTAKEKFRESVKMGVWGKERKIALARLKMFLERAREKIDWGLERAVSAEKRALPTYFLNEMVRYEVSGDRLKPLEFKHAALPLFLEAFVHALKIEKDPEKRKEILRTVRASGLYDKKLGMYKINAALSEASIEIGRARVFTPGWLENESVWLHMEYKFLLEMLRNGLTEEFFEDFKRTLVVFQPADRYGRSVLENSSFIVSSAFPDASLHGAGFVARLSGSTAEFLHIWLTMNVGKRPFVLGPDGKLSLRFDPHLPAFLFTKEETDRTLVWPDGRRQKIKIPKNSFAFLFLGKTIVVYHNPKKLNSFGKQRVAVRKITLQMAGGQTIEFKGDAVPSPYAGRVRDERVPRIDIELS